MPPYKSFEDELQDQMRDMERKWDVARARFRTEYLALQLQRPPCVGDILEIAEENEDRSGVKIANVQENCKTPTELKEESPIHLLNETGPVSDDAQDPVVAQKNGAETSTDPEEKLQSDMEQCADFHDEYPLPTPVDPATHDSKESKDNAEAVDQSVKNGGMGLGQDALEVVEDKSNELKTSAVCLGIPSHPVQLPQDPPTDTSVKESPKGENGKGAVENQDHEPVEELHAPPPSAWQMFLRSSLVGTNAPPESPVINTPNLQACVSPRPKPASAPNACRGQPQCMRSSPREPRHSFSPGPVGFCGSPPPKFNMTVLASPKPRAAKRNRSEADAGEDSSHKKKIKHSSLSGTDCSLSTGASSWMDLLKWQKERAANESASTCARNSEREEFLEQIQSPQWHLDFSGQEAAGEMFEAIGGQDDMWPGEFGLHPIMEIDWEDSDDDED